MSYAGRSSRSSSPAASSRSARPSTSAARPATPTTGAEGDVDWQQVALFGAGLAVGVVVGAGVALLSAPRSGAETRLALSRTARRGVRHTRDAWDDLGDELRAVRRLLRRRRARSVRAGGLEAGDGWDAGAGRPAPAR